LELERERGLVRRVRLAMLFGRPQPERDGGFIASTDGPVEVRQIPQEDGAEKGGGRKISGALQSC
jgi:hypothetical protein